MQTNNILCKIRFPLSLLFPWIRGEIAIKETSVRLWAQKATLGFIPSGSSQQEIQYDKISTAGWTSWMDTRKIRGALILFVLAFYEETGEKAHDFSRGMKAEWRSQNATEFLF